MVIFLITTSSAGLSFGPVLTLPMALTTSRPVVTLPKTACFLSSQDVGAKTSYLQGQ